MTKKITFQLKFFTLVWLMSIPGLIFAQGGGVPLFQLVETTNSTTTICPNGSAKFDYVATSSNVINWTLTDASNNVVEQGFVTSSTNFIISGLTAGNYTFATQTTIGQNISIPVEILSDPCDISASSSINDPTGFGCGNGAAFFQVSGTTCDGNFYYVLYDDLNNVVLSGNDGGIGLIELTPLNAGNYTMVISVENNASDPLATCVYSESFSIIEPACDIDVTTLSSTPPSSPTSADGSVVVKVTGSACLFNPSGQPIFFVGASDQLGNAYPFSMDVDGNFYADNLPMGEYVIVGTNSMTVPPVCFDTVMVSFAVESCTISVGTPVIAAPSGYGACNNNGGIVVTPTGVSLAFPSLVGIISVSNPTVPIPPSSTNGVNYTFFGLIPDDYIILVSQGACADTMLVHVWPSCNIGIDNGTASNITTAGGTGSYSFTVNTGTGNCDVASASLSGTSSATLSNLANGSSHSFNNLAPGNYTLTLTNTASGNSPFSTCSTSINFTITCSYTAPITVNGATSFCDGGSVNLAFQSGLTNYQWSNGGNTSSISANSSGNYTVTAEDGACTVSSDAGVQVTVFPLPNLTVSPANAAICPGQSIVLTSSIATGINWSTSETTQSITVTTPGSYSVGVIDNNLCSAVATANITASTNCGTSTTLSTNDCGNTGFVRTSAVYCVAVTGATGYQWEFASSATPTVVYATSSTSSNFILLHSVSPILNWGTTWSVRVKPIIPGFTTAFGNPCIIGIIPDPAQNGVPTTTLRPQDCGKLNYRYNSNNRIIANYIYGANQYEFEFTDVVTNQVYNRVQASNTLYLNQVTPALTVPGQYNVRVKARIGTTWGNFGATCLIGIISGARDGGNQSLTEEEMEDLNASTLDMQGVFEMTAMPNPYNSTATLYINCETAQSVQVNITDLSGRTVESVKANTNEAISVGSELSPGLYLINTVAQDGRKSTYRIVKQ